MMDKDIYTDLNNIITQIPGWMDAEDLRIEPIVDILIGAMVGLVAIVALVVAFSWVFARLWCKPKQEPPTRTPADHGLPFESISYSSHGVPVRGWFVPGESDASLHPVVILAHGWSRNGAEMLPLASLLHEAGFAVLLMEALYERAPRERTERLLISGRGHSDVMRDTRCDQGIVAFFCRTLAPGSHR